MNPDEYTKMYELEDHYWWFVGRRRLALGLLQRYLGAPDGRTVLDLGCGTGVVLRELSSWSNPIGFDMSSIALGYCRQRGLKRLVRGNGEALPFQPETLDGMIALDIFEHIADDHAAFAEAFRVLRPGGTLVLSVPAFKALWGPHDIALMHHRRYRRAEISALLREAGFEPLRVGYSVFYLFPIVVLWRAADKLRRGAPKASLVPVPGFVNRLLIALQDSEASLIHRLNLPWGSSVVAVARKPIHTEV